MPKKVEQKDVIAKFVSIHGARYNYNNIVYINGNTKVDIICNIHGSFPQLPRMHKSGQGCPRCAKEYDGWSYTAWKEKGEQSKHFDSFKVYIIECYSDNEKFYKIGKTFNTLHKRFTEKCRIPYDYKVLKVYEGESFYISKLEVELQNLNSINKYTPSIKFDGSYECFSQLKEETFEDY